MATIVDLSLDQGTTWSQQFQWVDGTGSPLSLSGYTVSSKLRRDFNDATASASLTGSVVTAASGTLSIGTTASHSAAIPAATYKYDVEITSASVVYRVVEGSLEVRAEVTK